MNTSLSSSLSSLVSMALLVYAPPARSILNLLRAGVRPELCLSPLESRNRFFLFSFLTVFDSMMLLSLEELLVFAPG